MSAFPSPLVSLKATFPFLPVAVLSFTYISPFLFTAICLEEPTPSVTTNALNPPGKINPPFKLSACIFSVNLIIDFSCLLEHPKNMAVIKRNSPFKFILIKINIKKFINSTSFRF